MKKQFIGLTLLSLILSGCMLFPKRTTSSSSDSLSTTSTTSQTASTTSQGGNSSSGGTTTSVGTSSEQTTSSEDDVTDLGVMTIKEVKEYIAAHPILTNTAGIGVDYTTKVTIKAFALSRFDLVKSKSSFGLNVSYPAKVMMGDATSYIACASNNGDGSTLFGKVDKYAGQDTSRYEVTGYLSMYLGQPEICVPDKSFTWNEKLDITRNDEAYVEKDITIAEYFTLVKDVKYNCAGHGYGGFYKIKNVTCYHYDAGSNFYYFTDGNQIVKVIKDTLVCSVGLNYDIIGSLSTANYCPALRGLKATQVSGDKATIDLSKAEELTATNLRKIETSQDDTDKRFDNFVLSFGKIYKATVYIGLVVENYKYDTVFTDTYLGESAKTGRDASGASGCIFVQNENFSGAELDELEKYNPYYADYALENTTIDVYYIPYYLRYSSKKPIWKVFLLPETFPVSA